MEKGTDLRSIQALLRHNPLKNTETCTQVAVSSSNKKNLLDSIQNTMGVNTMAFTQLLYASRKKMNRIGNINEREIFYISTKDNPEWMNLLPTANWVVFTIADEENREILHESTTQILDRNVTYTCSAGELAGLTEQYFDEEISWRAIQYEEKTGKKYDYEQSPMTTMHQNFSEGFWFSAILAYDGYKEIDKVLCVDFTTRQVKKHLTKILEKINKGWLPSDEEIELAEYDN